MPSLLSGLFSVSHSCRILKTPVTFSMPRELPPTASGRFFTSSTRTRSMGGGGRIAERGGGKRLSVAGVITSSYSK